MVEKRVARAVRRVAEVFEKRDEVDVDDRYLLTSQIAFFSLYTEKRF